MELTRRLITSWLMLLLLSGCGSLSAKPEDPTSTMPPADPTVVEPTPTEVLPSPVPGVIPIATDAFEGIIVTEDEARASLAHDVPTSTQDFWTPDFEHIVTLEKGLESYLRQDEQYAPLSQRYSDYKRQYIGIIEEGQQRIYALYVCSSSSIADLGGPFWVDGGGECVFELKYDLETEEFLLILIHGSS